MSKVAARFWNHKRIAQSEARERLKALGVLTGDEASITETMAEVTRKHFAPAMAKALFQKRPSLLDILKSKT